MKTLALTIALVMAVAVAVSLAMVHFEGSSSAIARRWVSPGPLSPRHGYLGNQCGACHEPTVGVTVTNCTPCHADSKRLLGRQPTAFHASIRECTPCHVEHQLESIRPLTMDHVELARIGAQTLASASGSDLESAATLQSLETWLRIRGPAQFDAKTARSALDCAGCHDRRDPHLKRFGSDCAQCHGLEAWSIPGYQHPSSRSKDCVQCHEPPPSHLMGHFSMMSQKIAGKEHASVDQCFECHNTTSWNDIIDIGFYKHH
ncbi:MAG: class III cytochrome C family protein [Deltaproteobacteria bacterium]|nr:class III cytochrome C family protein [Deltaproteobacteria bacterium]